MPRGSLAVLVICALALALPCGSAQSAPASTDPPTFDAITIKPPNPEARYQPAGFLGQAGGRVFFGGNIKMLIQYAFNLQEYQVAGAAGWTVSQRFEINAVPSETSLSRTIKIRNAEPTSEQRLMLQSLLRDRFGFKFHLETKEGEIYLLSRGGKSLQLKPSKDPARDPRALVSMKQDVFDGEAEGTNTTTDYLALRLSRYLQLPVLNQTGITGSYDFYLPPDDPENHDLTAAVLHVADRLGLKIKRGRGPIQTLVIDHVEQPSGN